ncbi:hypothetical protein K7432_012847 [Basidiobolus ranarum]|uniref:Uncharacterized protein n=1 Tax=Basidiobolus ranarum TaxID=34480 RepID=A0ABR2WK53_9FUNG
MARPSDAETEGGSTTTPGPNCLDQTYNVGQVVHHRSTQSGKTHFAGVYSGTVSPSRSYKPSPPTLCTPEVVESRRS